MCVCLIIIIAELNIIVINYRIFEVRRWSGFESIKVFTHTHDDKEIIGRLSYKYGKILFNLIKIVIINLFYLFIRWKLLDYYINLLVNISYTSYVFFFLKYIICMFNSCVVNLYYISLIIFTLKVLRLKTFLITVFLRNCEFAFLRSCVRTMLDMFRLVEHFPHLFLLSFLIWHIEIAARDVILFSKLVTIRRFASGTWSIYFIILI